MNIDYFLNRVSEEEKNSYYNDNVLDFYHYVVTHEPVCGIIKKLYAGENLDGDDWVKIYEGLALLTSKAIREESKLPIFHHLSNVGAKIGMAIFPEESDAYKECYQIYVNYTLIQQEQEIHKDLLAGLKSQFGNYILVDLKNVLALHNEHANFLNNRDAYYSALDSGESKKARQYRKELQQAYVGERKLVTEHLWWI